MNLVISIFWQRLSVLATAFAGTLFRLLEKKSPLLGNDDKFNKLFRRMFVRRECKIVAEANRSECQGRVGHLDFCLRTACLANASKSDLALLFNVTLVGRSVVKDFSR